MDDLISLKTVSDFQYFIHIEKPKHPLVSVFYHNNKKIRIKYGDCRIVSDLYLISLRNGRESSFGYGRQSYDFDEGTLVFTKPRQVMRPKDINIKNINRSIEGWTLTFHPDLLRKSGLATKMDSFSFFSYQVNEALHLSEEERQNITQIIKKIDRETRLNIDQHSLMIITSCIELLLNYCSRYYDRQFFTRSSMNNGIIVKFEQLLKEYFNSEKPLELGIPSVKYCGKVLNMSGHYLSDFLKKETGKSAQEHIHYHLIEKAKNRLISSNNSVGGIAYSLGFDYPQHFSKIFRARTGMSPTDYRKLN